MPRRDATQLGVMFGNSLRLRQLAVEQHGHTFPLAKRGAPAEWEWPTRIRIDTEAAESRTIIEVESEDRLGLLHRISRGLTRHGLSIHVARISTEKGAAIDTFYVRTAHGKKPTDEALLQKIKSELETELSEQKRDMDFTD